ncbi:flavin-containing amine [Diplodia corticola]|uniref:Amine oxidase n=1 Tax=Diplodia corticola TaxID=236234 RepID=A0A1J9R7P1_9PEZI|nr:flavin-containing amine [Diplodia corticola]OJD36537.1 flavin-containing amine [Diplodia corticola]
MSPKVQAIDPAGTPKAYYAQGTASTIGSTIHISGQYGATTGGHVPASYESQIHLALLNLRRVLATAGARVTDIAKLTLYIVNYDPKRRLHTRHIQSFLGSHRPAITLVPVPQLADPAWLFEVEAVASISAPAISPPISTPRPADAKDSFDVIVIGAGLSGLTAARDVVRGGLRCLVLEARDRVGGKTWSKPLAGGQGVVDLGAAWINDTNQTRMIALARQYGAELIEQNTTGNCAFQGFDGQCSSFAYGELPGFDPTTQAQVAHVRDTVESHSQAIDVLSPHDTSLDALTFAAYLRLRCGASASDDSSDDSSSSSTTAFATAAVWTRAMLGREPADLSALHFLNYCRSGGGLLQMRSDRRGGGQHLRCRQGMQLFATEMAKGLPDVRLGAPVVGVRQVAGGGGVEVETAGGMATTFRAKKVVVSVPSPVLGSIAFEPPLPVEKRVLVESAGYGYYTKVMLVFREAFWVEKGFCGLAQSFCGPASVVRDTSVPVDGKWILTCFLAGDAGKEWAKLSEEGRVDALLRQVGELYGDADAPRRLFVEAVGLEWAKERWSGWGCPCTSLPPGVLDAVGHALREPAGDVHFVGTETAGEWKGYMEGAVRSGERGAAEVLSQLSRAGAKL